jgi:glycosyltransferase involved in cell wall biosynthesis
MTSPIVQPPLSLSVIIMAFNEAATLEPVVRELDGVAGTLGRPYEVVIVDDGSTDGTGPAADRLAAAMPTVRAVHHQRNLGIGCVLRTGLAEARHDLFTVFPADGQCPAEILRQFVPLMNDHDVVLGTIPERKNTWMAILCSKAERLLFRALFGPMPHFQGIFMFRRAQLAALPMVTQGRGWIIQMEWILRAQKAGGRMISVPTRMRERVSGRSKVTNLRSILANLKQVALLYWRLRHEKDTPGKEV